MSLCFVRFFMQPRWQEYYHRASHKNRVMVKLWRILQGGGRVKGGSKWQKVWEGGGSTPEGTEGGGLESHQVVCKCWSPTSTGRVPLYQLLFNRTDVAWKMMFIAEDTWQPQSSPQGSTLNHKCSMRLADLVQLSDIFQFFQVHICISIFWLKPQKIQQPN